MCVAVKTLNHDCVLGTKKGSQISTALIEIKYLTDIFETTKLWIVVKKKGSQISRALSRSQIFD